MGGNKCPFGKKCTECVLYRTGLRYYPDKREPTPFAECAINIAVDCLENLVSRSIGQQAAMEQTRNAMNDFTNLLGGIVRNAEDDKRPSITSDVDNGRREGLNEGGALAPKHVIDVS